MIFFLVQYDWLSSSADAHSCQRCSFAEQIYQYHSWFCLQSHSKPHGTHAIIEQSVPMNFLEWVSETIIITPAIQQLTLLLFSKFDATCKFSKKRYTKANQNMMTLSSDVIFPFEEGFNFFLTYVHTMVISDISEACLIMIK